MKRSNLKTILLLSGFALIAGCKEVPNGHRGVVINFGAITSVEKEGLVWYNPFSEDVELVDARQLKWESETEGYTKDVQQAAIKFALTYRIDPNRVKKVYNSVGPEWAATLVPQVVEQSIKDVFGQSEAVKDAINNRSVVQGKILSELKRRLRARSVIVEGFELKDISFSDAFEKAVEAKQVAVENANAERNKTVAVQERANQKIITAKADAEAMRIKSAALSGNPGLTSYEAVQKWNGVLPNQMFGGAVPFINVK